MRSQSLDDARRDYGPEIERRLRLAIAGDGTLFDAARYHLETGGKRLRALLPPWVAHNLGGDWAAALDLGVAFELVHNGTLVHDDLQDGDIQRRGRPTVWTRFGMPQAVNVGTALMLLGVAQVLESPHKARLIADTNLAILRIVQGQALEFELSLDPAPTVDKWGRMAAGKTGALFGACFLAGARVAGLPDGDASAFQRLGCDLGVFFQMQDDLLDLVGDKGRDVPATDLAEGKISWPVAWFMVHGEAIARDRLLAIVTTPRGDTTREMVAEAREILIRGGAIAACAEQVASEAEQLRQVSWIAAVPGLVDQVLAPVGHVLPRHP